MASNWEEIIQHHYGKVIKLPNISWEDSFRLLEHGTKYQRDPMLLMSVGNHEPWILAELYRLGKIKLSKDNLLLIFRRCCSQHRIGEDEVRYFLENFKACRSKKFQTKLIDDINSNRAIDNSFSTRLEDIFWGYSKKSYNKTPNTKKSKHPFNLS